MPVRVAGPDDHILRLPTDMVLIICSLLLEESFQDFTNFYLSWVPYQTPQQISTLLHNFDWRNMPLHERTWWYQPRQLFLAFLGMCKDRRVKGALCYDASKNIILGNMMEENLDVLQGIADEHSASFVTFHVFNSICRPETAEDSATSLLTRLGGLHFRADLEACVMMLRDLRLVQEAGLGWEEYPAMRAPDVPLCSFGNTMKPLHFYVRGWPPTFETVLSCTCSKCLLEMLWYIIFRN